MTMDHYNLLDARAKSLSRRNLMKLNTAGYVKKKKKKKVYKLPWRPR